MEIYGDALCATGEINTGWRGDGVAHHPGGGGGGGSQLQHTHPPPTAAAVEETGLGLVQTREAEAAPFGNQD